MNPIGIIRSPFKSLKDMPIQPKGAEEVTGTIILEDNLEEGLKDLQLFTHIYLIYLFHRAERTETTVIPFMDTQKRGVFATRSPLRPNHLGLSLVRLKGVEGNRITFEGVDMVDKTPLLDIKPYIKEFDHVENASSGWLEADEGEVRKRRSDNRFL